MRVLKIGRKSEGAGAELVARFLAANDRALLVVATQVERQTLIAKHNMSDSQAARVVVAANGCLTGRDGSCVFADNLDYIINKYLGRSVGVASAQS